MPQAIHEGTAFNSRNRKVAIHCVFSVKDNTHILLIFLYNYDTLIKKTASKGVLNVSKAFFDNGDRSYREEILSVIRTSESDEIIRDKLEEYHENDIASVIDELSSDEINRLADAVGFEVMSEILSHLDNAAEYLSRFELDDAAKLVEQMDADEAIEALEGMSEERKEQILDLIEEEAKEDVRLIESYPEEEFGSRMSTNFISVNKGASVKGAMRTLVSEAGENDNIYTLFVTRDDGSFYGAIDLKDLIVARSEDSLEELIYTTFPYVFDNEIIADNLERLRGYDEDMIPVLSHSDGRILGVITSRDFIDIVDEELADDYAKLAALTEDEEGDEPVLKSIRKRVPWLTVLLFLGLGVSFVVGLFEGVVKELPLIVSFQSLILGMAGNVGTQSLAVTVRSLGEERKKSALSYILKETRIALLTGAVIGLLSFVTVGCFLLFLGGYTASLAFSTSGCVGASLAFAMMLSGFTGAAIPTVFHRMGIDPAIASGPLITTVNDLFAVVSYYGLAWRLLIGVGG